MPISATSLILGITLQDGKSVYRPGDTIVGYVHRKTPLVTPNASIRISLHGRAAPWAGADAAQANIGSYGPGGSAPFQFLDSSRNSQTILEGPLHIPRGLTEPQMWPFAITIPIHADHPPWSPSCDKLQPLHDDLSLPTSCAGGDLEEYKVAVDYWLQAELDVSGDRESNKTYTTTQGLGMVGRSVEDGPRLQHARFLRSFGSPRLVPGMQDAGPSVGYRVKNFFGAPTHPVFWFHVEVEAPAVVRVGDDDPVPFRVRVVPLWERSGAAMLGVAPRVTLAGLTVKMGSLCEVKCEGRDGTMRRRSYLGRDKVIEWQDAAVEIPCGEKCDFVDVGKAIGLRMSYRDVLGPGKGVLSAEPVVHDLDIYHLIVWRLQVDVVGKELECRRVQRIAVLPPGGPEPYYMEPPPLPLPPPEKGEDSKEETWIRPPEEPDAPPSFEEVQREDREAGRVAQGKQVDRGGQGTS
ncbi:hypothetical protein ACO1O0_006890 [Amphichorda felina]